MALPNTRMHCHRVGGCKQCPGYGKLSELNMFMLTIVHKTEFSFAKNKHCFPGRESDVDVQFVRSCYDVVIIPQIWRLLCKLSM